MIGCSLCCATLRALYRHKHEMNVMRMQSCYTKIEIILLKKGLTEISGCTDDGPTERFFANDASKTKVAKFYLRKFCISWEKYVLGFQITVDNVFAMKMLQRYQDLMLTDDKWDRTTFINVMCITEKNWSEKREKNRREQKRQGIRYSTKKV